MQTLKPAKFETMIEMARNWQRALPLFVSTFYINQNDEIFFLVK